MPIRVNLTLNRRLETASTQTKPAYAGYKKLDFLLFTSKFINQTGFL